MNTSASLRWSQAKNVLCVRLDYLGDVLMCTPAMRAVKQSASGRLVTLLSSKSGVAAFPFIPEIDGVIEYAAPWMKSSAPHSATMDMEFIQSLQSHAFDAAIIFTSYSQSALPAAQMCYLAGIPIRLAHCRENPYQLLTNWIAETEPQEIVRHEVRRQLDLVESVGWKTAEEKLSFSVRDSDVDWMRDRLHAMGIDLKQPWIMMHPGATAASRRYPAGHWTQVIQTLTGNCGYAVVLTGDASEAAMIEEIRVASGSIAHSLAGELDLGKLGAAISLASIVISNNTGPAHMASAIGTPLVDLYALTNPQHTPWQVESRVLFHDVPCRFCYKSICPQEHHDCLSKVKPAQVVEAAQSLFLSISSG
ncbi:MAG TPA: glycosyltransferase family 9 protein [Burkholderiaceae bacterium]|jgi:lipopolysaccharide heptosyltransferase II